MSIVLMLRACKKKKINHFDFTVNGQLVGSYHLLIVTGMFWIYLVNITDMLYVCLATDVRLHTAVKNQQV